MKSNRISSGIYNVETSKGAYWVMRRKDKPGYPGITWEVTYPSGDRTYHETKKEAMEDLVEEKV